MDIDFTTFEGRRYCNITVDRSRRNGILRFGHEISVTFMEDSGKWKFKSAWHVGVYEATWNADEEQDFNQSFPGLLDEMREEISKHEKENEV